MRSTRAWWSDMKQMMIMTRGVLAVSLMLGAAACSQDGGLVSSNPAAPNAGGSAASAAQVPTSLSGVWKLVSLQEVGQPAVSVGAPEAFTADFSNEGRLRLVADCNGCSATCAATDASLRVGPMACTRAYCATAPLDTKFAGLVAASTSWSVSGQSLELSGASGTLRFRR